MAIAVVSKTTATSVTDGTSYATGSITPTSGALIIVCVQHVAAAASGFEFGNTLTQASIPKFVPIVACTLNDSLGASRTACMSVWAGQATSATAGVLTAVFTNNRTNVLVSVVEITGHDTSTPSFQIAGIGAIRQTGFFTGLASAASAEVLMASRRNSGNGSLCFAGHLVNEVNTPGAGLTELSDIQNAEGSSLETSWAATPVVELGASWATSTAHHGIIGIELAIPANTDFVTDPIADLYT